MGKELAFSATHAMDTAANIMNKAVVFGVGCLGVLVLAVVVLGLAIAGGYNGLVRSSAAVDAILGASADAVPASSGSDSQLGTNG